MSFYKYSFEAPVERLAIGNKHKVIYYNVILLPDWCAKELPFAEFPKLRIRGEVGDYPVRGAWNPVADGRKYFILSAKFLKTAGLSVGDLTEMRFNVDDQDFVDVPDELDAQLNLNESLREVWTSLSSGKKRFYCHQISSAKQAATRDRRLQMVLSQLTS